MSLLKGSDTLREMYPKVNSKFADLDAKDQELKDELDAYKLEHEQQRQSDQLKVAKVEKELNDYKATMQQVNINQEPKQKATGYGVISLPPNAANGQVSVSVKGNTETDEEGNTKSTIGAFRIRSVSEDETQESSAYVIATDADTGEILELRSLPNGTKDEVRISEGKFMFKTGIGVIGEDRTPPLDFNSWIVYGGATVNSANSFTVNTFGGVSYPDVAPTNNIWLLIEIEGNHTGSFLAVKNASTSTGEFIIPPGEFSAKRLVFWGEASGGGVRRIYLAMPNGTCTITKLSIKVVQVVDLPVNPSMITMEDSTQLTYQLAEPVEIPVQVSGTLVGYPSGTVYIEPYVADAGIYTDKMSVLHQDLPIKVLEKLSKIDFMTGLETELDITAAVIAEDTLSFTHPDLTSGDIVFFVYEYDRESTIPEVEVEFYDSRYVVKDSATGKFYKWSITVTNGTPSIQLTEV